MSSKPRLQGSLPPGVHGAPRGVLKLTVNVQGSNAAERRQLALCLRTTWWGDDQQQPADPVPVASSGLTVLQWVVRCGSVRFGRYLNDAKGLLVSFHDNDASDLLGQVVISLDDKLVEPWVSSRAEVQLARGLGTAEVQLSAAFGVASRSQLFQDLPQKVRFSCMRDICCIHSGGGAQTSSTLYNHPLWTRCFCN